MSIKMGEDQIKASSVASRVATSLRSHLVPRHWTMNPPLPQSLHKYSTSSGLWVILSLPLHLRFSSLRRHWAGDQTSVLGGYTEPAMVTALTNLAILTVSGWTSSYDMFADYRRLFLRSRGRDTRIFRQDLKHLLCRGPTYSLDRLRESPAGLLDQVRHRQDRLGGCR